MYKNCKCILLPAKEKSNIFLKSSGYLEYNIYHPLHGIKSMGWKYQHLYIISPEEEIKEGEWCIDKGNLGLQKCIEVTENGIRVTNSNSYYSSNSFNKVIASTDKLLISHNYSDVNRLEDIEDYIPSIPQQFIEEYIESYNQGNKIEDVMVEYEEHCCNINVNGGLQSPDCCHKSIFSLKINSDNTISIKKTKDSYTREEVIELCRKAVEKGISLKKLYTDDYLKYAKDFSYEFDKWIDKNL